MSGKQYLADTNAFIYLLQKKAFIAPLLKAEWAFSFVTEIELLGKPGIKHEEIREVRQLFSVALKLSHNDSINEKTIALKQRYSIKIPDAIIAATAWQFNLPLLTADLGFAKIKEINIFLIDVS